MIITISGLPGSGKSTVAKLLAEKLGYERHSIGSMRRAIAQERGMTLEEFNALGEKDSSTDTDIDAWQKREGRERDNVIFEGRTSFHFIPHSYKIFLDVDLRTAARRIANETSAARRFEAKFHDQATVHRALKRRIASDTRRYKKYYRLNIFLKKHYNLVINTSRLSPRQVVAFILAKIKQKTSNVDKPGTNKKLSTANKHMKPLKKRIKLRLRLAK